LSARQLEAIIRLSESRARMTLSEAVTVKNVMDAVSLLQKTSIEAGMNKRVAINSLTASETSSILNIEVALINKLQVGSKISKKAVIDDFIKKGYEAEHIGLALNVLLQKERFMLKGQNTLYRLV